MGEHFSPLKYKRKYLISRTGLRSEGGSPLFSPFQNARIY